MILQPTTRTHAAQFYESEPFLHRGIVTFLTEPIRKGHPTLMISRPSTFAAVLELLRAAPDAALVEGAGRIVFVDVDNAITGSMVGTAVDPVRVEQGFMDLIARVRGDDNKPMWIYGEMVDVLCKQGNHAAALHLEQLWNVHFAEPAFSVLCGYAIEEFDHDTEAFRAICRQHTHVIPTEDFTDAADERARFEQVALLQQRVRASGVAANGRRAAVDARATSEPIVCVIDDDLSVRRSLSRLLVLAGCEVRVFASADEFLRDPGRRDTRCLVLDVQLIGLSSQELQSQLAAEPGAIPVVAMSGSHDPQVETEALRLGATAFLRKPFEAEALMDAIVSAMDSSVRGRTVSRVR
jgi:CheY-like chemotaxis protein